jgi:type II secretory pathway component PulF
VIFAYRTTTLDGTIHEGTIEADDKNAAVEKLKDNGFIPLTLKARKEGARAGGNLSFRSKKIT